jgi:hypothetical protein
MAFTSAQSFFFNVTNMKTGTTPSPTHTTIHNQLEWKSVCDSTSKVALCRAFKTADLKNA